MPNVLDIRRRIRSVKSTRQITKAMKMVSAAKLRRAQERALAARPYAEMLTNVLKSLVQRADVIDPETGKARHPLLETREERNIVLVVVTGDRGLAGGFNSNLLKAAQRFLDAKLGDRSDINVDLECVGRKGRDYFRRRFPAQASNEARSETIRVTGEHLGILKVPQFAQVSPIAEDIIGRYASGEIDAVYVVFNEFKSVIAQRLVVEQVLPVGSIGERGPPKSASAPLKQQRRRVFRWSPRTPAKWIATLLPLQPLKWITSTSNPLPHCSARCFPNTSSRRSTAPCWSLWLLNTPHA
jgi:F-type H+-transporting ATPase subunit gamma